jgi:hypothetical protein
MMKEHIQILALGKVELLCWQGSLLRLPQIFADTKMGMDLVHL